MIISGAGAPSLMQLADPADRLGQPLGADGLEQVVDGGQLEGLQGAVLVGGDEDDGGRLGCCGR